MPIVGACSIARSATRLGRKAPDHEIEQRQRGKLNAGRENNECRVLVQIATWAVNGGSGPLSCLFRAR